MESSPVTSIESGTTTYRVLDTDSNDLVQTGVDMEDRV
jgi:hypothetical protein